jgi:uncharacterized protein involved in propanediol utilization
MPNAPNALNLLRVNLTHSFGPMSDSFTMPACYRPIEIRLAEPAVGNGVCVGQHGELFQGQIEETSGEKRRCLISLPNRGMLSAVRFTPKREGGLHIFPENKIKAKRVVEILLRRYGVDKLGGIIEVTSNIPEAKGYGSSTADCVAAAKSVADAIGVCIQESDLAIAVVEGEKASDNLMFDRAVLFAHREGVVLEDYGGFIPPLLVLGIDTEPEGEVRTLEFPPAEYSWRERETFRVLTGALRRAIRTQDSHLLGQIACMSASINQRFLPKPLFHELHDISTHAKILGMNVAHSGTIVGLLLDPFDKDRNKKIDLIHRELRSLGVGDPLQFHHRAC